MDLYKTDLKNSFINLIISESIFSYYCWGYCVINFIFKFFISNKQSITKILYEWQIFYYLKLKIVSVRPFLITLADNVSQKKKKKTLTGIVA